LADKIKPPVLLVNVYPYHPGFVLAILKPKLSDCRGLPAFGGVAVATRKMTFRYSVLCGMSPDAVDAVRSAIPMGFKF